MGESPNDATYHRTHASLSGEDSGYTIYNNAPFPLYDTPSLSNAYLNSAVLFTQEEPPGRSGCGHFNVAQGHISSPNPLNCYHFPPSQAGPPYLFDSRTSVPPAPPTYSPPFPTYPSTQTLSSPPMSHNAHPSRRSSKPMSMILHPALAQPEQSSSTSAGLHVPSDERIGTASQTLCSQSTTWGKTYPHLDQYCLFPCEVGETLAAVLTCNPR